MTPSKTSSIKTAPVAVADAGRVRVGGGLRRAAPAATPASVRDTGRVRTGGGLRRN